MTQVQTMTNPELNRALAELMGFEVKGSEGETEYFAVVFNGWTYGMWSITEEEAWKDAPDYCTDPGASLEVQTAAIAKDKLAYLNKLLSMVSPIDDIQFGLGGAMEVVGYNIDGTAAIATASPRERAEAAYITLSSKQ